MPKESKEIVRLNYIGSKYLLLDWLTEQILKKTGWSGFHGKSVGDLFAGTGIVSYHFRQLGAIVQSNDAELYSSVITHAFNKSSYTDEVIEIIEQLNIELTENCHAETAANIVNHYSPLEGERKFFTIDNARRIDYLRNRIEEYKAEVTHDEYMFLLASLLVSADAISNVPAVYGCFLKKFKTKATRSLILRPVHQLTTAASPASATFNKNVLDDTLLEKIHADVVYLDPPYNERQYSKNYFPLNIIAKSPSETISVKGVTGIPSDCFISPFCKRGAAVEAAFEKLFKTIDAKYVFLSYNSESLIAKSRMLELMSKYGEATVEEREYKRFKSFEYNEDKDIQEYLFCLRKR